MSTVKSKQRMSLLKAEVLAIELLKKTIDVCSSKNNFPIRKKWAIPSDLYLEAREFCVDLCLANDIKVEGKDTAMERLRLGSYQRSSNGESLRAERGLGLEPRRTRPRAALRCIP